MTKAEALIATLHCLSTYPGEEDPCSGCPLNNVENCTYSLKLIVTNVFLKSSERDFRLETDKE